MKKIEQPEDEKEKEIEEEIYVEDKKKENTCGGKRRGRNWGKRNFVGRKKARKEGWNEGTKEGK